ncbi:MAG: RIP metalloprotease RseP [Deltaproteobacteria bacterium]|nr:RIP metalloprotease RseP [Deltaproteobacteria bacterium]
MDVILEALHIVQYYILPFVVVLGLMIFFHELGHFLVAKYFGVKVLKFALGFGPVLAGKTFGETEYSIRYFPLGGFVKMSGEDISDVTDKAEDLPPEEIERSFSNQHPLKRVAIVAAGPIFNLVLALFMFCGIYLISGIDMIRPEIGQVTKDSPAQNAGFLKGDVITSIEGEKVERWRKIKELVKDKPGTPLEVIVKRDGQDVRLIVTPEEAIVKNEFGEDVKSSLIGIVAAGNLGKIELKPWQAIKEGFKETFKWIKLTLLVVGKLFQGVVSIKTLGGPILIGQMTGQLAQENISYLIPFMAIISINLGILNLFPIPILDGGLIVFLLIELVIGKPLSIKKRELAQKIGLFLLISLMAVVFYNDVTRILK